MLTAAVVRQRCLSPWSRIDDVLFALRAGRSFSRRVRASRQNHRKRQAVIGCTSEHERDWATATRPNNACDGTYFVAPHASAAHNTRGRRERNLS